MEKPLHVRVAEALGWAPFAYQLVSAPWWEQMCVPPGAEQHISTLQSIPRYDTDWSATGPLIERFGFHLQPVPPKYRPEPWCAALVSLGDVSSAMIGEGYGETPLIAVCNLILELAAAGKLAA